MNNIIVIVIFEDMYAMDQSSPEHVLRTLLRKRKLRVTWCSMIGYLHRFFSSDVLLGRKLGSFVAGEQNGFMKQYPPRK